MDGAGRHGWIAVALLALVAGILSGGPAGAETPVDTLILTLRAGPEGAEDVRVGATYTMHRDWSEPGATGIGTGSPDGGSVNIFPSDGGTFRVATTRGLQGEALVTIDDRPDRDDVPFTSNGSSFSVRLHRLEPDAERAYMVFHTGTEMSDIDIEGPVTGSGSVELTDVEARFGADTLRQADPENDGTAIGVGPAAAGASSFTREPAEGIVGGVTPFQGCLPCLVTITKPDGTTQDYFQAGLHGFGERSFAGPAGTWGFAWTGAGGSPFLALEPAFGAYTTVGERWPYFESG